MKKSDDRWEHFTKKQRSEIKNIDWSNVKSDFKTNKPHMNRVYSDLGSYDEMLPHRHVAYNHQLEENKAWWWEIRQSAERKFGVTANVHEMDGRVVVSKHIR